jgi:hypothetical protein
MAGVTVAAIRAARGVVRDRRPERHGVVPTHDGEAGG